MKLSNRNGAAKRGTGRAFLGRLRRSFVTMLALAALALSLCVPVSAGAEFMLTSGGSTIGVLTPDLVADVTIKDKDGNVIPNTGGTLYVGESYTIELKFQELGPYGAQFNALDGTLTYQLPKALKVEPQYGLKLKTTIGEEEVEFTYSIDENGLLTINVDEEVQEKLKGSWDTVFNFTMEATAQRVEGGDDDSFHFGDEGQEFWFEITDQPCVSVDKRGQYTENDNKGGQLEYTVTTKVEHGEVSELTILDVLTPPNTAALKVEDVNTEDIKVTLKRPGPDGTVTEIELKAGEDYELVAVPDEAYPGKNTFQIKLKEDSENTPLKEGDVLEVTYPYDVQYVEGSTDVFWGNVVNDVHVTGTGSVPSQGPDGSDTTKDVPIDEERGSNVEIQVVPPGDGIIFKTQEFSEADHKLHYTLYTTVPAGNWTPFYIQDDMVVEFGGQKYNLMEFKQDGRVSNLKVSAVDVENGALGGWSDSTDEHRRQSLEELKEKAKELTGYDIYNKWSPSPEGYDPMSVKNCIRLWDNNNLDIIFGKWEYGNTSAYGSWNYTGANRLIITEYDLDMSDAPGLLNLVSMSDYKTTIEKSASEVLLAGITNTVHMRFDGYNPGYSVFFNNAERMNKTGAPDKSDNSITWTVTMNTTDTTVNQYFREVKDEWMALNADDKYHWGDMPKAYSESMQAVFYDALPEGWEYVEGSLTATARNRWGNQSSYPYDKNGQLKDSHHLVTSDGGKQVIRAPLMFFYDAALETGNLFDWFNDYLTSLTFTYKLKATDEWLKANAQNDEVTVHNHAEIRDKLHQQAHWSADANVPYLPKRLTKEAEQVGDGSNLLKFTLHVNTGGEDLDKDKTYLFVTDTSTGINIQTQTIQVLNEKTGEPLTRVEGVSEDKPVGADQWAFFPTGEGQFKLMVPDGVALTITYDTLIPEIGDGVKVSNSASIDGVKRSSTDYEDTLVVNKIASSGEGTTHELTVEKVDEYARTKGLRGATFKFYSVVDEGFSPADAPIGASTEQMTIGENTYWCYSEPNWTFTTGEDGAGKVESAWRLYPGYYYVLEEIEAPDGYLKPAEPILIYFGVIGEEGSKYDEEQYPGATVVYPYVYDNVGPSLTVADPPRKELVFRKADGAALENKATAPNAYLAGAQFELWVGPRPDPVGDKQPAYTGVSSDDGFIQWTKDGETLDKLRLPDGIYYLYETAAPDGYDLLEEPIVIEVHGADVAVSSEDEGVVKSESDGKSPTITVTVMDQAAPYELPESGGPGTVWLYALGGALILTAALALACDVRRRRARS